MENERKLQLSAVYTNKLLFFFHLNFHDWPLPLQVVKVNRSTTVTCSKKKRCSFVPCNRLGRPETPQPRERVWLAAEEPGDIKNQ